MRVKVLKVRGQPEVKGSPHLLSSNRASPRPTNLLFLDTETTGEQVTPDVEAHRFRFGVTCYVRRRFGERRLTESWLLHRTPESLCGEIERRARGKTALYVYASNPSFDLWVLKFYSWFVSRGWRASFIYSEGVRFILVCRRDKASIKVCAVQNYFKFGVKQWGEMVGLPKLDTDPLEAPLSEVETYCRRDVEIIKETVLRYIDFCEHENVGGWGLTLSGQAFNCFRHRFLKHRLWVHRQPEVLALERRAYFGGRTDCFFIGKRTDGPFVEVDVNSLYPFIMSSYPLPYNLHFTVPNPTPEAAKACLTRGCVVADVTLNIKRPLWAVLIEGRTCFPVGEWRTGVCSIGLLMAIKTGALRKIHSMAVYKRGPIFTEFVREFYTLRLRRRAEGNEVFQTLAKYFMNGLYGKFGQANPKLIKGKDTEDPGFYRYTHLPADGGGPQIVTQIMGRIFMEQGREEHKDSMPAVAAHVTEYGRFYLAKLITAVGWDNVLYCDTDSLLIPERVMPALTNYLHETALGGLKVSDRINSVTLHGAKDYIHDGKRVIKGIPEKAVERRDGEYVVQQWPGFKSLAAASSGDSSPLSVALGGGQAETLDWQREGVYPIRTVVKVLSRKYRKGTVEPGGRVTPYEKPPELVCQPLAFTPGGRRLSRSARSLRA